MDPVTIFVGSAVVAGVMALFGRGKDSSSGNTTHYPHPTEPPCRPAGSRGWEPPFGDLPGYWKY